MNSRPAPIALMSSHGSGSSPKTSGAVDAIAGGTMK